VSNENNSTNSETTRKKDTNMKMNRIPLHPSSLALVATAIATFAFASAALGDDGIAASPKVRQTLNERKAAGTPAVTVAPAMACPKCADLLTTEANRQAKGGQVLAGTATEKVAKHTCTACETKLTVVGEGKARHTVATHKCAADVPNPATCCAMK
jgi:hypothetical protein